MGFAATPVCPPRANDDVCPAPKGAAVEIPPNPVDAVVTVEPIDENPAVAEGAAPRPENPVVGAAEVPKLKGATVALF